MRKPNEYTADYLWQQYLKLTKLDAAKMPAIQIRETKRAFYGALGNMLVMLQEMPDDDDAAADILTNITNEVGQFWGNTMLPQN